MNAHERIKERLVDFALRELPEQQSAEVEAHLTKCQQCSSELRRLQAVLQCAAGRRELSADEQVCESAKQTLLAVVTNRETRQPTSRLTICLESIRRTIMKSPITKLAAAAVIVIGAFLAIQHFGGSMDGASAAWADVRAAFLAQSWVHLKYDSGREQWISLEDGKFYYKNEDGRKVFVDRVSNIRLIYSPDLGEHISQDRPAVYLGGVIPPWQPKTAWEIVVGNLEAMTGQVVRDTEVQKEIERLDNMELVRFDVYHYDAIGRRLLVRQLWANPETRLPVRIWERLQLAERKEQKREFVTGEFDFPASGPSSIYELGVNEDLPIVKEYDRIPEPSIAEVIRAGSAGLGRFPDRYRSLTWSIEGYGCTIDVVYRNGEKIHHNRYFTLVGQPDYSLKTPASAEDVLQWTQTQVPVSIALFDGRRSYTRTNPHPSPSFAGHPEPTVRVLKEKSVYTSSEPHNELWPYASIGAGGSFGWIDDKPEELSDYVGLRSGDRGDTRRDFYIDPEHDHICVRWIWWKERAGKWEKEREYECSDFVQLPQGQWYPSKRVLSKYPDATRGTDGSRVDSNIDIKVLEENEYPADTFNGEKLLEGAKVESY